jgi:ABC-type Fe2+-enterobactin transport system substrate-binding protein
MTQFYVQPNIGPTLAVDADSRESAAATIAGQPVKELGFHETWNMVTNETKLGTLFQDADRERYLVWEA